MIACLLRAKRRSPSRLLDQQTLRNVALAHEVCPYYLSQEMARWADLVIADYNYYFDFSALLYGLAQANQWRVATLVDEAHNLVERARQMYSASLDQQTLNSVRHSAPAPLEKPFKRLNREWNALHKEQVGPYQVHPQLPAKWLSALSACITAIGDYLNDHPQGLSGNLQGFYFEALQFNRVAELFDGHFLFDVSLREDGKRRLSQLNLRNVVPAGFIGPRLKSAQSNVLFSATLSPYPLRQPVGLAVRHGVDGCRVAVPGGATKCASGQPDLDPVCAPPGLAGTDCRVDRSPVRAEPGNHLAFFRQLRLPATGRRAARRTPSSGYPVAAGAAHG